MINNEQYVQLARSLRCLSSRGLLESVSGEGHLAYREAIDGRQHQYYYMPERRPLPCFEVLVMLELVVRR